MKSSSRRTAILIGAPVLLMLMLLALASHRPLPLAGLDGPARMGGQAVSLAYAPDGTLICGESDGTLQSYAASERKFRDLGSTGTSFTANSGAHRLAFLPDGKSLIAAAGKPGALAVVYDLGQHKPLYSFQGPSGSAFDVSPDGKWAAVGDIDGVSLVDLTRPVTLSPREQSKHPQNFRSFAARRFQTGYEPASASFSPDSSSLVIGVNGNMLLFDVAGDFSLARAAVDIDGHPKPLGPSLKKQAKYGGSPNPFWIEWAPDGTKFAAFTSTELAIFNSNLKQLASTTPSISLPGGLPQSGISSNVGANLVWTKNGKTLFSGGDAVRRWNSDLQLEANFGVSGPVTLSPDEKYLVTCSQNGAGDYPYLIQWKVD